MKVLITKPGLDGHDCGAKVVAHALRDAIRVVVAGTIPPRDIEALRAMGVERVFPMGTALPDIMTAFSGEAG